MSGADDRDLLARLEALPREIAPDQDLWPGIADRIARRSRARRVAFAGVLAAAAAVAAIGMCARVTPRSSMAEPLHAFVAPPRAPVLMPAEAAYLSAIAALERDFDDQRASLSAEAVRAVDESVATIRAAIDATRAALADAPDDEALQTELLDEYQQAIDVISDALDAATRT